MERDVSRLWWSVVQVASALAFALLLATWAPWQGAKLVTDLPPDVAASLPRDCQAAVNNHGQYSCFRWGTKDSNPTGYAATTAALFGMVGLFLFIGLTGRGIWDTKGARRDASSKP